jgi:hypothetical protein
MGIQNISLHIRNQLKDSKSKLQFGNSMENQNSTGLYFFYETHLFKEKLRNVSIAFNENVTAVIVQKLILNKIQSVERVITQLDYHLAIGLQSNFDGLSYEEWRVATTQPFYRLHELQDSKQPFHKFLKLLKLFFEIHYVEMPAREWNELSTVAKVFYDVKFQMQDHIRSPIHTDFQWGLELKMSKQYLYARSSAQTIPSAVNGAINWIKDRTKNLLDKFTNYYQNPKTIGNDLINKPPSIWKWTQHSDINSSLVLLDLIVRKVTGIKPTIQHSTHFNTMLDAQGIAINITSDCEQLLMELSAESGMLTFDFPALQSQLMASCIAYAVEDSHAIQLLREQALTAVEDFYRSNTFK